MKIFRNSCCFVVLSYICKEIVFLSFKYLIGKERRGYVDKTDERFIKKD